MGKEKLFRLGAILFLLLSSPILLAEDSSIWSGLSSKHKELKFLPPEEAFQLDSMIEGESIIIRWQIANGYYLYQDKTVLRSLSPATQVLGLDFPPSISHNDPEFGKVQIYRNSLVLKVPLESFSTLSEKLILEVDYQGCADAGLCYPPTTKLIELQGPLSLILRASEDKFGLNSLSLYSLVLSFLGFGLLLSMTPCVFPMIPILSGILVGNKSRTNSFRALYISSVYVIFMAATYSFLGILVALLGRELKIFLHQPFAIFLVAGIFFAMGFSMLGLFSFSTPSFLNNYLHKIANTRSNSISGVASMGCLSALIATPCVTPPLAAVLTFIADSGSPTKGALVLFSLGIGMGIPLIFFGTSIGYLLPKSGDWMDHLKKFTGIILLAFGVWFTSRLLPDLIVVFLWLSLVVLLLVYLGPSLVVWTISKGVVKSKGLAWTLILFSSLGGAFIFLNISGHEDGLGPRSVANLNSSVEYKTVNNLEDLNSELSLSALSGRPVLLEFYADWCVECKRMESRTFADAEVVDSLKKYTFVRIDITDNTKDHREILGHFNLFGPPALIFFSKNQSRETERLIGFVNSKKLMKTLSLVQGEEF